MSHTPRRNALPITIFPFLDVLVCTMGSLILILILLSARMRSHASEPEAEPTPAEVSAEPDENVETPEMPALEPESPEPESMPELPPLPSSEPAEPPPEVADAAPVPPDGPTPRDREMELRERIAALTAQLDSERAVLRRQQESLLAARRRTIEAQAALHAVRKKLAAMEDGVEKTETERQQLDEERERLENELVELNRQIRKTQQKSNDVASKFAFVPYDGTSGTTRRPILIECTSEGLRFIPEDVVVRPGDVAGFNEKQNPLLAGASALCRYWSTVDGLKADEGQETDPYVLLIVRPSGHIAYYYAQKMLSNLRQQHGYELLDDDDKLDLPVSDPKARACCLEAVQQTLARRDRTVRSMEEDEGEFPEMRRISRSGGGSGGGGGAGTSGTGGAASDPRVARGGTAGPGGGEGRMMRFRPGVGFEEVEPESKPAYDDPFDRAENAWEAKKKGKSVGAGSGRGASGDAFAGGGTGWSSRGKGAAGPEGGAAEAGGGRGASSEIGEGDGTSPFEKALRAREAGSGGMAARGGAGAAGQGPATPGTADGTENPSGASGTQGEGVPGNSSESASEGSGGSANGPSLSGNSEARGTGQNGAKSGQANGQSSGQPSNGQRGGTKSGAGGSGGDSGADGADGDASGKSGDDVPAGPGANFGPRSRRKGPRAPGERHWGYASRRASIGFQRDVTVQVLDDRLIVGNGREIQLDEGTSAKDTVDRIVDAVDAEAWSWGRPPDSFYYVPTLKFVATPGAERSVEPLRVPLKKEGLSSTVQTAAPPKPVTKGPEFPEQPAAAIPATRAVTPANATGRSTPAPLPTETLNGAPPAR